VFALSPIQNVAPTNVHANTTTSIFVGRDV
jgi:hypothetical protein